MQAAIEILRRSLREERFLSHGLRFKVHDDGACTRYPCQAPNITISCPRVPRPLHHHNPQTPQNIMSIGCHSVPPSHRAAEVARFASHGRTLIYLCCWICGVWWVGNLDWSFGRSPMCWRSFCCSQQQLPRMCKFLPVQPNIHRRAS